MNLITRNRISLVATLALTLLAAFVMNGCSERNLTELELASADDNPMVFEDEFLGGLDYAAFEYSFYDAFSIDETVAHSGTASMKVAIPADQWAGGSFYTHGTRNLSLYNALTFYARASSAINLTNAGFGLGIIDDGVYKAQMNNIPLTTEWTQIVIPIPNSARLTNERGMFWYNMGASSEAVDIWFDDVQYANVAGITDPRPSMTTRPVQARVGEMFPMPGTRTVFNVAGTDYRVYHNPGYFTYYSSNDAIAKAEGGTVEAVSLGEATITAKLVNVDVDGVVTAQVVEETTSPIVFMDAFDAGLDYAAFEDSYYDALSIDEENGVAGSAAMKYTIPQGNWAGGAIWTHDARDLSSFNALVFDARANGTYNLEAVGFGIGMDYGTDTMAEVNDVELTTEWARIIIPIPNSDRLAEEHGVFWFSTGNAGEIWFDNVHFANVEEGVITNPRPVMASSSVEAILNEVILIEGTETTFEVDGQDILVDHTSIYFDYYSSDEAVATALSGVVTAIGGGSATITALLGETAVDGEITVNVIAPPTVAAPTPSHAEGDVISIFSDAYTDITVDTWLATTWGLGPIAVFDQTIDGDNVKAYTGLTIPPYYGGIEFVTNQIDAVTPGMTHFHTDIYAPSGTRFAIKVVDFGPDGAWSGGDDTEHLISLNADSTPPFETGQWISLDIPLTELGGMNLGNVAQLVLTGSNAGSVWLDNIYFHK